MLCVGGLVIPCGARLVVGRGSLSVGRDQEVDRRVAQAASGSTEFTGEHPAGESWSFFLASSRVEGTVHQGKLAKNSCNVEPRSTTASGLIPMRGAAT